MRRLYLQIYLALVASLLVFAVLGAVAWTLLPSDPEEVRLLDGVGKLVSERLPSTDDPSELQEALERLSETFPAEMTLYSADGNELASIGNVLPPPSPDRSQSGWVRSGGRGPALALRLPDGRWLVARHHSPAGVHLGRGVIVLGLLAVAMAAGAYPVSRRLTRRLERLKARVDRLGAGELSARVDIEGADEVASLARSFNRAAERIDRLVGSQRTMLAGVSHELRTPLTRIRMAVELLAQSEGARPELRKRLEQDIAELDDLIEELLLASRLDVIEAVAPTELVDLLALLAEEASRTGAEVEGEPIEIRGDGRMLRRLIRNLLENASRYAHGSEITTSLRREGAEVVLRVADRGPGIPKHEHEKIFEPFYRRPRTEQAPRAATGGVGLGLALVRQIARRHGGEARCLPRDGSGACFEVRLPVGFQGEVSEVVKRRAR